MLNALDRLHESDSRDSNEQMAEAMAGLVHLRDMLIERYRTGEDCRDELDKTNAIISALFGVEFPVGGVQWRRVCETREALREMLAEGSGGS